MSLYTKPIINNFLHDAWFHHGAKSENTAIKQPVSMCGWGIASPQLIKRKLEIILIIISKKYYPSLRSEKKIT
jgi:hypothetical protein